MKNKEFKKNIIVTKKSYLKKPDLALIYNRKIQQ